MAYSLIWLPQVLRDAGLKVAVVEGWEERGKGDVGAIYGVMCHHTATDRKDANMPTLHTLVHGRSDLPGPLSQLGLGRDGTYYVIAAGRCNHAGKGIWKGLTNGNANFIGIEAENSGLANDFPWPAVQLEAYQRGVAAILRHVGHSAGFCVGHKEYALPHGRKPDPSLDMASFRSAVGDILSGKAPSPTMIPRAEPGDSPGRPTLRRGETGPLVRLLQGKVGVLADGNFGPKTEAAVRAFQRVRGLVGDGIVGPKTWVALDGA